MNTLTISDVKPGKVTPPREWTNGKWIPGEPPPYRDLDPHQTFLSRLVDKKYNYQTKEYDQTLFHRVDNITAGEAYHRNFIEYLEICWKDHVGAVVTPDIVWYTLLCELASAVKADVERYRPLFSDSTEKQNIIVETMDLMVMPLDLLVEKLKDKVPTNTDLFLPEFTTTTERSLHAEHAAFCDMCSPYYNYMMLACGIPAIDVRGELDDWNMMVDLWNRLSLLFAPLKGYFNRVDKILRQIIDNRNNPSYWTGMFKLIKCGSGSDVEVCGWITELFREQPRVRYPGNFPAGVSIVPYEVLATNKHYEMKDGLFFSRMEDIFLVPDFGSVVLEKIT